jgi:hypothetical protein
MIDMGCIDSSPAAESPDHSNAAIRQEQTCVCKAEPGVTQHHEDERRHAGHQYS